MLARRLLSRMLIVGGVLLAARVATAQLPDDLQKWLGPQSWQRDVDGPILSLGPQGQFDDTHIFAPTVARDGDRFLLWYCGSTGFAHDLSETRMPDERVFKLGLATSADGKQFQRHASNPVLALSDARLSVLTPALLRDTHGALLREDGKLRMWFTSAALGGGRGHAIQQATSSNGVQWQVDPALLLERAYAQTVVRTEGGYEMWYTQPGRYPWVIRHARSPNGSDWEVTEQPVLEITQDWENYIVIYPVVLRVDDVYLMWYASYMTEDRETTGIGFAVSRDGVRWHKHPQNPVLRPDPARDWESHYVSSHSVMRLPDGSFRIWYASRKAPPFLNLYFALNTARWEGP